jgi:crotonobetainyl-CoA:carnitine CoA-transferase CaiB-like acyl-CoA transferase
VLLGAFFLASCGINAASRASERTGVGQHVETPLMDGALPWTTMLWSRAEHPMADLTTVFRSFGLVDLSGGPPTQPRPPVVGVCTREVLFELEYARDEFEALRAEGVVNRCPFGQIGET